MVFFCPVLEPTVWCQSGLAFDTHRRLLDRVVSGASLLAGGVLECNLSHRRSVAVLCMLYKTRNNYMQLHCGALPLPVVPVRLHAATWSLIGILMHLLFAKPYSTQNFYTSKSFTM